MEHKDAQGEQHMMAWKISSSSLVQVRWTRHQRRILKAVWMLRGHDIVQYNFPDRDRSLDSFPRMAVSKEKFAHLLPKNLKVK